jgi:hypothetical protein
MGALSFVVNDMVANINIEKTIQEIHNLSYFYHWGRKECWNTPCSERGVFVDQIKMQIKAESGNSVSSSENNSPKYKESN